MKVIKTLDLDGAENEINEWYADMIAQPPSPKGSERYNNSMKSFNYMLQQLTNKAFKLGQDNS
jgi:hypothetical protein